jgi:hypothetical protein
MPHILILDEWKGIALQMCELTETIGTALANGEYDSDPKRKSDAEALMAEAQTFWQGIETSHRTEADAVVGNLEAFLGI